MGFNLYLVEFPRVEESQPRGLNDVRQSSNKGSHHLAHLERTTEGHTHRGCISKSFNTPKETQLQNLVQQVGWCSRVNLSLSDLSVELVVGHRVNVLQLALISDGDGGPTRPQLDHPVLAKDLLCQREVKAEVLGITIVVLQRRRGRHSANNQVYLLTIGAHTVLGEGS